MYLYAVTECAADGGQFGEFGGVGLVMHAIYKRFPFAAFLGFADGCGHSAVGKQHEFLDELVGVFGYFEVYSCGMAGLVDVEAHFLAVEIH